MADATAAHILTALNALAGGRSLTQREAAETFDSVMRGAVPAEQLKALLLGLKAKGETADEVAGAASALRAAMTVVDLPDSDRLVDTCGTGGGTRSTINLSTGAAFIVAGAGVPVAKHGNRSYTSRSGSADVLEALGISLSTPPERLQQVLQRANLVFLFAPTYHPAMRHAAPVRRELGVATIMNLLGPLANPARVTRQVLGVADRARAPLMANALVALGSRHALVVHAAEGMDEISPVGMTEVWEVRDGTIRQWAIEPERLGIARLTLEALAGGEPAENARRLESVLREGERGVVREALVINAAAALYVAGRGWGFEEALARATAALDEGRAWGVVERLREATKQQGTGNGERGTGK